VARSGPRNFPPENGIDAKPIETPEAVAASCMNLGRNEYVRLSRNTARKKIGLMMTRSASPALPPVASGTAGGGEDRWRWSEFATWKNRLDRKAAAMNSAAKFFTLRATRS
jgi:hypothetical protein